MKAIGRAPARHPEPQDTAAARLARASRSGIADAAAARPSAVAPTIKSRRLIVTVVGSSPFTVSVSPPFDFDITRVPLKIALLAGRNARPSCCIERVKLAFGASRLDRLMVGLPQI